MKKIIIFISVVMMSVTVAQTNRSISKSFTLKPKRELVKTIPVINMEKMNLPSSGMLTTKKESITISGKIEDENKIRAVFLNNKRINLADDGNFETSVVLSEGENTFTVDVENVNDGKAQTEFTILFSPDYSFPQLEINDAELARNGTINYSGESYNLKGRVTDDYGLKSLLINEKSVNVEEDGVFNILLSLVKGENKFSIKAFNIKGKLFEKELTIISEEIYLPIVTFPTLKLSKDKKLTVVADKIDVVGQISDSYGIKSLYINSQRVEVTQDGKFSKTIELNEGSNTITVNVKNIKNKSKIEVLTITSNITAPTFDLSSLNLSDKDEIIFDQDRITLRGKVEDVFGVSKLLVNNREKRISIDGTFSCEINLQDGRNEVFITAINNKNKRATKKIIIVSNQEIFSPIIAFPNLHLNENKELVVPDDKIDIVGQIRDSYGVKSLYINSQKVDVERDGKFSKLIQLKEGSNKVTVNAKNIKNKYTIEVLTIISRLSVPSFDLGALNISDKNELIHNEDKITITGKVKDDYGVSRLLVNNREESIGENGNFTITINLIEGSNNVVLTAINEKNKRTSKRFTILSSQTVAPPQIAISEPFLAENMELTSDDKYVRIKGTANDVLGIKEITVSLNDRVIQRTTTNDFEAYVSPGEGVNRVSINAVNAKDASSILSFTIIQPVDNVGPEITIYEPKTTRGIQVVHKSEILSVRGKAIDESGVFKVTVNNVTTVLLPNGEFQTDIRLKMGENRLVLQAFDNKYNASADTFFVVRELDDIVVGKYYALIIGINKYEGYWPPLGNAVNDAKDIAAVLQKSYKIDKIYTLFDEEATEDGITQTLYNISDEMSAEDNLIIYYAGHGYLDPITNRGYWVPAGSRINLISRYISNSDLRDIMAGLKSKHILLITDACFAGDIFRGLTTTGITKDPNDMNKYYRQVYSKTSRIAMTSGGVEPVQDAGKDGHSIFTYYLLKSLKENKKKYMDVEQLYNEFKVAVTNNSNQSPRLDRIKNTNDEGGQFIFIKK